MKSRSPREIVKSRSPRDEGKQNMTMLLAARAQRRRRRSRCAASRCHRTVRCAALPQLGVACHNVSPYASHGARMRLDNSRCSSAVAGACCMACCCMAAENLGTVHDRIEPVHVAWSLCQDRSSISRGESGRPTRSFMTRWCKHACLAMLCAASSVRYHGTLIKVKSHLAHIPACGHDRRVVM